MLVELEALQCANDIRGSMRHPTASHLDLDRIAKRARPCCGSQTECLAIQQPDKYGVAPLKVNLLDDLVVVAEVRRR